MKPAFRSISVAAVLLTATIVSTTSLAADPIYEVLHELERETGGGSLQSERLVGTSGRLFGTTVRGGQHGFGAVFAVDPDGTNFEILHRFDHTNYGSGTDAPMKNFSSLGGDHVLET